MTVPRFLILFSIIVAGSAAVSLGVSPELLVPKFWLMFSFLAGLTVIAYIFAYSGLKSGGDLSVYIVLGSITFKLLFSLVFVAVYLSKISVKSIPFAVEFFSLYFLFTIFEIYALLCNLRHQNKT